jgi:toluene monooxygenase system ferredoxin subunit
MAKRMVCRVAEVPENTLKECEAEGGLKLVVANAGGEFFGVQAICPHQEVPLCEGMFDGSTLTCHMHLWQWDVRTGAPMGIAEAPLERFALVREGDALYLGGESSALDVGELFTGLASATLEKLVSLAKKESHPAGATLYRPGDAADDFYVLDSGRVEFQIGHDPAGFMLKKGEVFGWAALLESHPQRIASARVLESATVLRINGRQALGVLESDPASGYVVMRRLAGLIARFFVVAGAK